MKKDYRLLYDTKEEFLNITRLIYYITEMMQKHHLIDQMVIDNKPEMVNPFYGRLQKGSAYVVEFSRGVPSIIHSTLGGVQIPAAEHCRGYLSDYKGFIKEISRPLGLKEIQPVVKNRLDTVGPRCVVSKMQWLEEGQQLPTEFKPHTVISDEILFGTEHEEVLLKTVYDEVNQYFLSTGHPEFVHQGLEKKVVQPAPAPKKRTCAILGQLKDVLKTKLPKDNGQEL